MLFTLIILLSGKPVELGQYTYEECATRAELHIGAICEMVPRDDT
jgi:hypothetical protein